MVQWHSFLIQTQSLALNFLREFLGDQAVEVLGDQSGSPCKPVEVRPKEILIREKNREYFFIFPFLPI